MTENQTVEGSNLPEDPLSEKAQDHQKPAKAKSPTKWLIAGVVGMFLICLCVVAIFVIIDPFDLRARFFGAGDPITQMVPEDTFMYFGLNLLELNSPEMRGIFEEFQAAYEEDLGLENIESNMEEEFGFTIDDVTPWIGQFAGIILEDLPQESISSDEIPPVMLLVEVRNKNNAKQFIDDFVTSQEDSGTEFDSIEISGISFYKVQEDYSPLILGMYRNMMVFASGSQVVEDFISFNQDSFGKSSLAKSDEYKNLTNQMPKDRFATFYMNSEKYFDILESFGQDIYGPEWTETLKNVTSWSFDYGFSVTAVDAGLKFDMIAAGFDPENSPYSGFYTDLSEYDLKLDVFYPKETFFYVTGYIPEGYSETMSDVLQDQFGQDPAIMADFEEAIQLFEEEYGIDLEKLGRTIEGEFAMGIFEQSGGVLPELGEIPFGLNIMIGINDPAEVTKIFDLLNEFAYGMGPFIEVNHQEINGYSLEEWLVVDMETDVPALVYGNSEEFALIGSGMISDWLSLDGDSLADNPTYQETWKAFPEGDLPVFYFDFEGFVEIMEFIDPYSDFTTASGNSIFGPMTRIAMSSPINRLDQPRSTMILFIDYQPLK